MNQQCSVQMNNGQDRLAFLLMMAKKGEQNAREALIQDYNPFILRAAAIASRRYINPDTDDEYSVALIAFNEAIDSYRSVKNRSFLSFAKLVIRRRLIDYFRHQRHKGKEIPMSGLLSSEELEEEEPKIFVIESQDLYQKKMEIFERRMEIEEFKQVLARFGISFHQLVEFSPKHKDTRENLFRIAEELIQCQLAREMVIKEGILPYAWMTQRFGLSRKTLRHHRLFLVTLCLLKTGDFPYLADYIRGQKER